ncbi:TPA: tail fiber domain-containing protein [Escherichia coli]|nr:tail fiber domain-containing protein [Escherichia coli]
MWYREGTITFTQGSNTLVGAGTAWNVTANGVLPGMIVIGPDNKLYEIKRVTSDTNIVLSEPYTGETQSEVPCRIITTYEGDLTQFSARFTALMSRMSADSKSMRSWLTALDEVTIEREDGTEVTVKPLIQIVNEHNENVEWYKNNTDAIDAAGDKAREAAASAAAAAESANTAGEKASQASQSASAAASSQSAASASATAAKKSETNAAASQKSAATSASTATTKASEAATSARDASASKVAAKSSETSAASSAGSAASSATAAGNSAKAAKTSETNADNSAQAAADSQTASANSATAAKKSETNAKNSEAAAKVSETNAKASENKAKEYLDKVGGLVSPMTQYDWPVVTGNESFYIKIAKLSDPGSNNCHVTLMVTNAGNYGSTYGNIDFIEISARGLPSSLTADNVSRYLSIRRLGATGLTDDNQMRYGLVKGDGFIEVWAFQRAFINGAKVAVLAQTARTELYIPDGFVKQTAAPSGYVEGNVVRIYDQVNKPTKADLGLSNAMLTGAFGLGGSGIATTGKMSDVEILKALRDKGGHFWRGDKPTGSTATIYSHGSGIFSRCGDTWSAINIDYSTAKIKIYAGNDARLNNGTFSVNELYGSANKPSKSDVGLGNVTNDAQVKKSGDNMSGDLAIIKGTPSLFLRSKSGTAHVWFQNEDQSERGVIWAPTNTDTLGEVHIRAKNAKGESRGDFIVRHDGRVESRDLKVTYKISAATAEFANTSTNPLDNTLKISGPQHTPLVLTRSGSSENVSIGFKLDNVNQKYLGIDTNGDLAFGESPDQKQNSKLITQAKLDKGLTIGGQLAFKGKTAFSAAATFSAGIAGAIDPEDIGGQTVDLNNLTIISDVGAIKYYYCPTIGGGAKITNKPDGVTGNFLLRVESTRKVSASDYANMQTLISNDTKRIYVRFVVGGSWAAWSQVVVSGWGQDVSVKSLSAVALSGSLTGNASTATKLQTARTIGGVSFDGSANIDLPGVNKAGNQSTTGNAATATKLQTARTINGVKFDGSANISIPTITSRGRVTALTGTTQGAATGLQMYEAYNNSYPTAYGNVLHMKGASAAGEGELLIGWSGTSGAHAPVFIRSRRDYADAAWSAWAQVYTAKDSIPGVNTTGNQNTTGNAATATKLQTARKIAGVAFDGSADITLTAANLNAYTKTEVANLLSSYASRSSLTGYSGNLDIVAETLVVKSGGSGGFAIWDIGTTTSGANMYIDPNPGINTVWRSTSSRRYKKDIETLQDRYADELLSLRPVWYRSICRGDRKDWGYYGLIAEEVGEIAPQYVHWREPTNNDSPEDISSNGMVAEGVMYERLVVPLIHHIQQLTKRVEELETKLNSPKE